jgi:hypothetical protein
MGNTVETSKGARIPTAHAIKLWERIVKIKKSGIPYEGTGALHAGQYKVNRIDANGDTTIGCHFIKYDELAHCASLILTNETQQQRLDRFDAQQTMEGGNYE